MHRSLRHRTRPPGLGSQAAASHRRPAGFRAPTSPRETRSEPGGEPEPEEPTVSDLELLSPYCR